MTITETDITFKFAGYTFRIDVLDNTKSYEYDLVELASEQVDERGMYNADWVCEEADAHLCNLVGLGAEIDTKEAFINDLRNSVEFLIRSGEFDKAGN